MCRRSPIISDAVAAMRRNYWRCVAAYGCAPDGGHALRVTSGSMAAITGSSTAEIHAPLEQVWAVIEDVEQAPEWQGGLKALRAIERDGDGRAIRCETETDVKVRTVKSTVRISYDRPTTVSMEQEKGDLKSLHGSWELEELGGAANPGDLLARGRTGSAARHGDPRTGDRPAARDAHSGPRRRAEAANRVRLITRPGRQRYAATSS